MPDQCRCMAPMYVSKAPATPPSATPAPNSMLWLPPSAAAAAPFDDALPAGWSADLSVARSAFLSDKMCINSGHGWHPITLQKYSLGSPLEACSRHCMCTCLPPRLQANAHAIRTYKAAMISSSTAKVNSKLTWVDQESQWDSTRHSRRFQLPLGLHLRPR